MKRNIDSLQQLRMEIDKLTLEKAAREKQFSNHIKEYAQAMKPANLIKNAFTSITGDSELKSMLKTKGTEAAIGFVVTQLLFKNANPLIRTAATVLGTTFASSIFGEDAPNYVDKIKSLYQKFRSKKPETDPEFFNEEDVYTG